MAKHDRAKREKSSRNAVYALRFKQRKCEDCGHKSCRGQKCALCDGKMK